MMEMTTQQYTIGGSLEIEANYAVQQSIRRHFKNMLGNWVEAMHLN